MQPSTHGFPRSPSSILPGERRQGFDRPDCGCDRDEPTVELGEGNAVEFPVRARSQCADWIAASSWNRPRGAPSA